MASASRATSSRPGAASPPTIRIYNRIERFADLGLPLRATEFDIGVGTDEALQGTLMHDYLTVIFSHPAIEAITMWGFWQGSFHMPNAALYRSIGVKSLL